ncbi:MAG TPA: LysR substrate-binding domain-containing protein, partial [Burkholderiaceae bacterium]
AHSVVPMASFNDAGLMLQAAEQGMGVALTRELLAADALLEGRLVRVAARHALDSEQHRYHLVYPPALENEPALRTFRAWLHAEVAQSAAALTGQITGSETRPANR